MLHQLRSLSRLVTNPCRLTFMNCVIQYIYLYSFTFKDDVVWIMLLSFLASMYLSITLLRIQSFLIARNNFLLFDSINIARSQLIVWFDESNLAMTLNVSCRHWRIRRYTSRLNRLKGVVVCRNVFWRRFAPVLFVTSRKFKKTCRAS